jgi:hypothetical protein
MPMPFASRSDAADVADERREFAAETAEAAEVGIVLGVLCGHSSDPVHAVAIRTALRLALDQTFRPRRAIAR